MSAERQTSRPAPARRPVSDEVHDRFRLLVFDWDGTLMDSIGSIVECMRQTVASLGLPPLGDEAIRSTIGLGLRETMDELYPDGDEELFGRIVERYREHWLGGHRYRSRLFEGARETLESLAGEGYLLAVATGKGRAGLDYELASSGVEGLFAATRTVSEAAAKPAPDMLLELLDELAIDAVETLMIGDTTHDLHMAAAAGVPAVGVTCGSHRPEVLTGCRPLALLDHVTHLPPWLADLP